MGRQEFLIIIGLLSFLAAILIGRALVSTLRNDQRMIVGGIAILIGIGLVIYGISSVTSVSSEIMFRAGRPDIGGIAAIALGILVVTVGLVLIASKGRKKDASQSSSTKKCPFCAETIQSEAKICRYCGKMLEVSTGS